jgi:hypothetical protein
MIIFPIVEIQLQWDSQVEASLGYAVRPCLKKEEKEEEERKEREEKEGTGRARGSGGRKVARCSLVMLPKV